MSHINRLTWADMKCYKAATHLKDKQKKNDGQ